MLITNGITKRRRTFAEMYIEDRLYVYMKRDSFIFDSKEGYVCILHSHFPNICVSEDICYLFPTILLSSFFLDVFMQSYLAAAMCDVHESFIIDIPWCHSVCRYIPWLEFHLELIEASVMGKHKTYVTSSFIGWNLAQSHILIDPYVKRDYIPFHVILYPPTV